MSKNSSREEIVVGIIVKLVGTVCFLVIIYYSIYGDNNGFRGIFIAIGLLALILNLILEFNKGREKPGS